MIILLESLIIPNLNPISVFTVGYCIIAALQWMLKMERWDSGR